MGDLGLLLWCPLCKYPVDCCGMSVGKGKRRVDETHLFFSPMSSRLPPPPYHAGATRSVQKEAKITIPRGVRPGNTITVNLPDGRSVQVVVPKGMRPGNILTVKYTAQEPVAVQPRAGNPTAMHSVQPAAGYQAPRIPQAIATPIGPTGGSSGYGTYSSGYGGYSAPVVAPAAPPPVQAYYPQVPHLGRQRVAMAVLSSLRTHKRRPPPPACGRPTPPPAG